jgi:hypothetical protein
VYTLVLDRLQSISDQEIRQNLGKTLQPVFRALYSFAIVLGLVMAAVLFLIQKSAL